MSRLLKAFLASETGNTLTTFALAAAPMLVIAGLPMDYLRLQNRQAAAQAALDESMLSVVSTGATFSQSIAQQIFQANFAPADVTLVSFSATKAADGSITGTASYEMKASLLAIMGVSKLEFDAKSTVAPVTTTALDSVTFTPTGSKGAYDKEIFFFTKDKNGTIIKETKVLDYDYTWNAKGGFANTTTASGGYTEKLTVGAYNTYGISMKVYEDLTYKGKRVSPVTHYSDDKDVAKWTKSTGKCSDAGGQVNAWEDGGDTDFADFQFKLTCTTATVTTGDARLKK